MAERRGQTLGRAPGLLQLIQGGKAGEKSSFREAAKRQASLLKEGVKSLTELNEMPAGNPRSPAEMAKRLINDNLAEMVSGNVSANLKKEIEAVLKASDAIVEVEKLAVADFIKKNPQYKNVSEAELRKAFFDPTKSIGEAKDILDPLKVKANKKVKADKKRKARSRVPTSGGKAIAAARKAQVLKADPLGLREKVRRSSGGKGGGGGFGNILQFDKTTGRFRRARLLK